MRVDGLLIPDSLLLALEAGRWPRTPEEARQQNLRSLVPEDRIRQLAPGESQLYLYPPPFSTVARVIGSGHDFYYARFGAVEQLVPEAAVEIADFGLGSDALVLLDYRTDPTDPQVIRLLWSHNGQPNRWVVMAPDFSTFADVLGPFRPVLFSPDWRTDSAVALTRQMYESRDFGAMPILADALQDAGCENADILDHCRGSGPHVRGCWVVDLVLGKE